MNHNEILERLEAYHDLQLSSSDRRNVESHLSECTICTEALNRLTALSRAVFRPVPPPANTEIFVSRVMARIRESEEELALSEGGFWRWPALALTALALFLIATAPSDNPSGSDNGSPSTRSVLLARHSTSATISDGVAPVDSLLDIAVEEI